MQFGTQKSEMVALGFTLCNYLPFPHAIGYTKITLKKHVITYTNAGDIVSFFKFDFCVFLMKAGETAETLSHQTIMLIKR